MRTDLELAVEYLYHQLLRRFYRQANKGHVWSLFFNHGWEKRMARKRAQGRQSRRDALRRAANIPWHISPKPNP